MATDYPIEITDPDGSVRFAGLADFPDPDNQPSAGPPFQAGANDTLVVVENSDGDPVISYDDSVGTVELVKTHVQGPLSGSGDADFTGGTVDASQLGPTILYVTVQSGAPGADYATPLVFDSTATTGGLYAWDGSAYQKVGLATT